jgi:hypothetical protein
MFWLGAIAALAIILVYAFVVRPVLANQPAFSAAFKAEASFRDKLQAKVTGWRTKIAARLLAIAGVLVGCYDQLLPLVSGQDWTSLTQKVPGWVLPVGMVALAWLFSWLRKVTENPPIVVTQKDDAGEMKVVDLIKPVS